MVIAALTIIAEPMPFRFPSVACTTVVQRRQTAVTLDPTFNAGTLCFCNMTFRAEPFSIGEVIEHKCYDIPYRFGEVVLKLVNVGAIISSIIGDVWLIVVDCNFLTISNGSLNNIVFTEPA